MKLFIWKPQGFDDYTVSVVAENLEIAQRLADDHVKKEEAKGNHDYCAWGDVVLRTASRRARCCGYARQRRLKGERDV